MHPRYTSSAAECHPAVGQGLETGFNTSPFLKCRQNHECRAHEIAPVAKMKIVENIRPECPRSENKEGWAANAMVIPNAKAPLQLRTA